VISLLPTENETIVLPWSGSDVYRRMQVSTSQKTFLQPNEAELLFNGWVLPYRFRVSLRYRRPGYFQPLVTGKIEVSTTGCILFLRYRLFPMTRTLMQLWSVLIVLGTAVTGYSYRSSMPLLAGLVLFAAMHLIARSNFKLHLGPTREAIHRVVA